MMDKINPMTLDVVDWTSSTRSGDRHRDNGSDRARPRSRRPSSGNPDARAHRHAVARRAGELAAPLDRPAPYLTTRTGAASLRAHGYFSRREATHDDTSTTNNRAAAVRSHPRCPRWNARVRSAP